MNHGTRQGQSLGRGDQGRTAGGAWPLAVGLILLVVVTFGAAACPYDDDHLVLENLTINGIETFQACLTITAGPGVTVSAAGAATFRAEERIVLRPGFRVQAGGLLVARIGLSAGSAPLNDTGIDWCANADTNDLLCPVIGFPGQDGDHGRDALARAGQLSKVGGGVGGFDFTKISNSGAELLASATLGSGPDDWACTRDNVTGLIWEVKVTDNAHLRYQGHIYSWYFPDSPDGNPGWQNGGICVGSDCDTTGFVDAVNAQGLCGASDWRVPTRRELQGIVNYGRANFAIDPEYFPNVWPGYSNFWSSSVFAQFEFGEAWMVALQLHFSGGAALHSERHSLGAVRVVRDAK